MAVDESVVESHYGVILGEAQASSPTMRGAVYRRGHWSPAGRAEDSTSDKRT